MFMPLEIQLWTRTTVLIIITVQEAKLLVAIRKDQARKLRRKNDAAEDDDDDATIAGWEDGAKSRDGGARSVGAKTARASEWGHSKIFSEAGQTNAQTVRTGAAPACLLLYWRLLLLALRCVGTMASTYIPLQHGVRLQHGVPCCSCNVLPTLAPLTWHTVLQHGVLCHGYCVATWRPSHGAPEWAFHRACASLLNCCPC
jgi:hypothetical protein